MGAKPLGGEDKPPREHDNPPSVQPIATKKRTFYSRLILTQKINLTSKKTKTKKSNKKTYIMGVKPLGEEDKPPRECGNPSWVEP